MIILWSQSDMNGTEQKDWINEVIIRVEHQRDPIPSHVKTTVRAYKDAYNGPIDYQPVYNHYVPYSRISKALIERMEQSTRKEIITQLSSLSNTFGISTPRFSKGKDQDYLELNDGPEVYPTTSKFCFHFWCNHIYQNICDWSRNIFLGPSIGDHQGKRIDLPVDHIAKLSHRLLSALDIYGDLNKSGALKLDVSDPIGGLESYRSGADPPLDNKRPNPYDNGLKDAEKKLRAAYEKQPKVENYDEIWEYVTDFEDEGSNKNKKLNYRTVERGRRRHIEKGKGGK